MTPRLQQLRAAREKATTLKKVHQQWQVRKGPRVAPTVSLERRAA